MGGDPFFLPERDTVTDEETSAYSNLKESDDLAWQDSRQYGANGLGPSPKSKMDFLDQDGEWDGTVDEEAHFDLL
jgi:hypothetical protein